MRFGNINYVYFDGRIQVKFVFIFNTRYFIDGYRKSVTFFRFCFVFEALYMKLSSILSAENILPRELSRTDCCRTSKFTFCLGSAYYYCECPTSVFPPSARSFHWPIENIRCAESFRCIQSRKSMFDKILS